MNSKALVILLLTLVGCSSAKHTSSSKANIVLASEVDWTYLNPKRGDKAPSAGTLWGDRKGTGATGFLVKFKDGFASPPHIHNITYRGVVLSGSVHNDDPAAERMWLPKGSFWTQPKAQVHITAAKGKTNIAYLEIEEGPYLVLPKKEAFDNGERPVNVDPSNIVWVDKSVSSKIKGKVEQAFLWGKMGHKDLSGSFIKLPAGFSGKIKSKGKSFKAVLTQGELKHRESSSSLDVGSHFSSEGKYSHKIKCQSEEECIVYVRSHGCYKVSK